MLIRLLKHIRLGLLDDRLGVLWWLVETLIRWRCHHVWLLEVWIKYLWSYRRELLRIHHARIQNLRRKYIRLSGGDYLSMIDSYHGIITYWQSLNYVCRLHHHKSFWHVYWRIHHQLSLKCHLRIGILRRTSINWPANHDIKGDDLFFVRNHGTFVADIYFKDIATFYQWGNDRRDR